MQCVFFTKQFAFKGFVGFKDLYLSHFTPLPPLQPTPFPQKEVCLLDLHAHTGVIWGFLLFSVRFDSQ